ncbi:isocitrate/isopropylmalate dehydrogenase family protein [Thiohalomonas denitrificans]|uniref:Tartrate dehydrogenase/decarboxylase / D-malate dehydrogenase n=1 Tax=Thiohalomonas denitrificans TaxID=415747 RepID=A0A1G5PVW0_9GAMM|nr:isocitrate/isopropylmalate family dehydrogenase [Thiohalomonas denitrificans]SCZ53538.1 tartrate dehydrogenase/decarboxylase / D-malate dehydrogenase [Thiohalomonas denitrificans]
MHARTRWRIAVAPGDGVGREVMPAAVTALKYLMRDNGPQLELTELEWPATAYHRDHGRMMPEEWRTRLAEFDALLLGALGDPGPSSDAERYRLPDAVSLAPILAIRQGFDQWVCERPAISLEGAPRYLADKRAGAIDMLVIRENSEGEYIGQGGRTARGTGHEVATQVEVFTRFATERLFRHAFERARQRSEERAAGRRPLRFGVKERADAQVCLVTKRNALRHWGEMYTEIFAEVAAEYPGIETHHELVDAACMKFVTSPWRFDVVVASNLQGDILTDLAAVLCGGLGVAPSCNLNPSNRAALPMFEPTHGSAPDIAGKDLADPRAMLLTTAMMLDWMGEEDASASKAAGRLRRAVEADLREHQRESRPGSAIAESILGRIGG